jgi:hypothetical protein
MWCSARQDPSHVEVDDSRRATSGVSVGISVAFCLNQVHRRRFESPAMAKSESFAGIQIAGPTNAGACRSFAGPNVLTESNVGCETFTIQYDAPA